MFYINEEKMEKKASLIMLWMKHSNIDVWYIIYYYVIFNKQCKYSRKAINKISKIENNHAIVYFHNFEGETIVILKVL